MSNDKPVLIAGKELREQAAEITRKNIQREKRYCIASFSEPPGLRAERHRLELIEGLGE